MLLGKKLSGHPNIQVGERGLREDGYLLFETWLRLWLCVTRIHFAKRI